MKARVSQLHNTEAAWQKHANWIPEAGELVVYDPDDEHSYSRIKIGDGKRSLQELDFFIESIFAAMLDARPANLVDAGRIMSRKIKK